MKKLLILLAVLILLPIGVRAVVVNNSGSLGADSISFPFYVLDSAGNMIATASGDSVFLRVWYPSGALAFEDSLAYDGAKITAETQHGVTTYSWKEEVAAIDGTPRDGVYAWQILVHDLTSAALWTPHSGHFQLYQTYDYDTWADRLIDSLQAALDSTQAIMTDLTIVKDTTQGSKDLLDAGLTVSLTTAERAAIEDSIYAQRADYKSDVSALATAASLVNAIDSINAILDSVQLYLDESISGIDDNPWDAGTRTLTTADWTTDSDLTPIIDSLYAVLDSVQAYLDATISGRAVAGDAMTLTAGERGNITEGVWGEVSQSAIVEDSTGNSATRVQTNLTEATNDHYIGQIALFLDGTEEGQARLITDYDGTLGWLSFTPALTSTPAADDSLRIMPWTEIQKVVGSVASVVGAVGSVTAGVTVATNNDKTNYTLSDIGLDSDTSFTNLQAKLASVYAWVTDSTFILTGRPGRTLTPFWKMVRHVDRDTLFLGVGTDTIFAVEYFHIGGSAGGPPDSGSTIIWP